MSSFENDPLTAGEAPRPAWADRRFFVPFVLLVVVPVTGLGYVAARRFLWPRDPPPPPPVVHELAKEWQAEADKVEAARAEYRAGLDAKRAGDQRELALAKLEGSVALFEAAIRGGESVLERNRKALVEGGMPPAEAERQGASRRDELARWRLELEDASKVLGSLEGAGDEEPEESGS